MASDLTPEEEKALFGADSSGQTRSAPLAADSLPPVPPKPPQDPGMLETFQASAGQGFGDVAGGVQRLVGAEPTWSAQRQALLTPEQVEGIKQHPWIAGLGRTFGQTATTLPAVLAAGWALPETAGASLLSLAARGGYLGSLTGAIHNLLTSGQDPNESLVDRARRGAEWGAVTGPFGGFLEHAAGAGQTIPPEIQAAGRNMQQAGVDVGSANLPRTGGTANARGGPPTTDQAGQINKAWGNIIDQDIPSFSPQTNQRVFNDLGQDVGKTAAAGQVGQHANVSDGKGGTTTLDQRLSDIEAEHPPGTPGHAYAAQQVQMVRNQFDPSTGLMPGGALQNLVQKNGLLERATRSSIAERSDPAIDIEQALHDGFADSSGPGVADAYRLAREKFKLAVAGRSAADPVTGNMRPDSLMTNITKMYPNYASIGQGPTLTDRAINFARDTAATFGGRDSAAPLARGGWIAPLTEALVGGGGAAAAHFLPAALPTALQNPFVSIPLGIGLPAATAGAQGLAAAYRRSPLFAQNLLMRGNRIGRSYLGMPAGAVGASASNQPWF